MPHDVIQGSFPQGSSASTRVTPRPHLPPPAPQTRSIQPRGGSDALQLPAGMTLDRAGGQPLPDAVRKQMERTLGGSFTDVRVHVGREASALGALAFTHGSNIYFAPGQYNPHTAHGQELLGHELTHVLQQRAGRVRNPYGTGIAIVQDHQLEAEADRMGRQAANGGATAQPKMAPADSPAAKVQIMAAMVGNGGFRFIAGSYGRPIGSVMLQPRGREAVEVTDLGVDHAHRERGVGSLLMASAVRKGLQLGRSKVTLAAQDSGSGRLTAWYRNMGFAQVGVTQRGFPRLEAPIDRVLSRVGRAKAG